MKVLNPSRHFAKSPPGIFFYEFGPNFAGKLVPAKIPGLPKDGFGRAGNAGSSLPAKVFGRLGASHCEILYRSFERRRGANKPSPRPSKHMPRMHMYTLCATTRGGAGVHRWDTQCRTLCQGDHRAVVGSVRGRCEILYRFRNAPPHQDALPEPILAHAAHAHVPIVCCNAREHRGVPLGHAVPRTLPGGPPGG